MEPHIKKYLIGGGIALVLILGVLVFLNKAESGPGKLDQFATCLADKGLKFYGAFWCPHCQAQKKLFGNSAKLLPYKECSLPDASGQNAMCNELKIASYPTWVYPDNSTTTGEVTLQSLAEKSGCSLPSEAN